MFRWQSSIKNRVRAVILLVSVIVLLMTAIAFVIYEIISFKEQLTRDRSTLAAVIADNSAAPLAFDSETTAAEILAALKAEPDIVAAVLYDGDGKIFARYPPDLATNLLPARLESAGLHFRDNALVLFTPVIQERKQIGTLYLRSSLQGLNTRLWRYGTIVAAVLSGSLVAAYILSTFLQRRISHPILALTDAAQAVSQRRDYSLRAPKLTDDELGTLTDAFNQMLTETQEHQARLAAFQTELERQVADRTAKLQETIGELEAFSYSVSHDMRSPLRAMEGYAKALSEDLRDKLDPKAKQYLERIARAASRLDRLIQDVLAYSRVAKGDITLHPVDLEALIDDLLPNHPEFQPPKAQVTIQRPLHRVRGHEAYLTQCVTNLLGNAVKFVAPGVTPHIRIYSERIDGRVRLWFEDNGIGIDPSHQGRIFQIFGQVHSEKKYGGTGIGLAIVRKAAQRMNGEVGVESELGKGSRFWLVLDEANP